jgi:hypothetical protein
VVPKISNPVYELREWERLTEGVQYVVQDLKILDQSAVHRTWVRVLYLSSGRLRSSKPFSNHAKA